MFLNSGAVGMGVPVETDLTNIDNPLYVGAALLGADKVLRRRSDG